MPEQLKENLPNQQKNKRLQCGIIMPISRFDDCSEVHWAEVKEILEDAIDLAGFDPHLVSDADDIGIIQKRIIESLYYNPIVVCDVSGKNPNVMFELGLRLAFDKPTVIVKDDKTTYSFDTAPIEHLEYPRDLRYPRIVDFKEELIEKIKGTYKKATEDKSYTTFLKNFGPFMTAKIDTKEVTPNEMVLEEIRNLRQFIVGRELSNTQRSESFQQPVLGASKALCLRNVVASKEIELIAQLKKNISVLNNAEFKIERRNPKHVHIRFVSNEPIPWDEVIRIGREFDPRARKM